MGAERARDDFVMPKTLIIGCSSFYIRGALITYEQQVPEYHLTNGYVK
jgi:hypothetical protein